MRTNRNLPWNATESVIMGRIVDRALFLFPDRKWEDIWMDLTATIMGGCRLRLDDLLAADDFNFVHDIVGIERHLDRQTFEFKDCFVPRFRE